MNILLVVNEQKDNGFALANEIVSLIGERADVFCESSLCDSLIKNVTYISEEKYKDMDFFLVLGGDGTILGISKIAAQLKIPVIGVNLGRVGFFSEIEKENLKESLDKLIKGDFDIEKRMMLSANFLDKDNICALNDIVITRENSLLKILEFDVFLDDEFVDHFMADGVIISTPTGSTAYSLSAGGPIVDPSMNIMIITPICPHKMYSRTIIVPSNKKITIKNSSRDGSKALVVADSQMIGKIESGEDVVVNVSNDSFRLIKLHGLKFFSVLRDKLVKKEK